VQVKQSGGRKLKKLGLSLTQQKGQKKTGAQNQGEKKKKVTQLGGIKKTKNVSKRFYSA